MDGTVDIKFALFAAALVLTAVLASIAIWSRRHLWLRITVVVLVAAYAPVVYLGLTEVLSRPKPMEHEWFKSHVDEVTVLSMELIEGEAIYLWLRLPQDGEPKYYSLPWQPLLADRLEDLIDEGLRSDKPVRILNPFSKKSFEDLGDMNMEIIEPPSLPMKLPPEDTDAFDPRKPSEI